MEMEIDVRSTSVKIEKVSDDYDEYYRLSLLEKWSNHSVNISKEIKAKLNEKQLDNLIEMLKKAKEIEIDDPAY